MSEPFYLNTLKEGQSARVAGLTADGPMRRRLLDIGLIEGTKVECLQKSPAGDPVAYAIRGAVIALRAEDSRTILMEKLYSLAPEAKACAGGMPYPVQ
jgi:ferrous iron transport protein A